MSDNQIQVAQPIDTNKNEYKDIIKKLKPGNDNGLENQEMIDGWKKFKKYMQRGQTGVATGSRKTLSSDGDSLTDSGRGSLGTDGSSQVTLSSEGGSDDNKNIILLRYMMFMRLEATRKKERTKQLMMNAVKVTDTFRTTATGQNTGEPGQDIHNGTEPAVNQRDNTVQTAVNHGEEESVQSEEKDVSPESGSVTVQAEIHSSSAEENVESEVDIIQIAEENETQEDIFENLLQQLRKERKRLTSKSKVRLRKYLKCKYLKDKDLDLLYSHAKTNITVDRDKEKIDSNKVTDFENKSQDSKTSRKLLNYITLFEIINGTDFTKPAPYKRGYKADITELCSRREYVAVGGHPSVGLLKAIAMLNVLTRWRDRDEMDSNVSALSQMQTVSKAVLDQLAMAALQEALEGEDRDNLELSIMLALSCDVIEGEELLNQAVVRLDFLKVKHSLEDAVLECDMVRLGYSVPHCIEQGYTRGMAHLLQQAQAILASADAPSALDDEVREIRGYQMVLPVTVAVVTATLLLLGEPEAKTKKWKLCRALMPTLGTHNILRRTHTLHVNNLHSQIVARVRALLWAVSRQDVMETSESVYTLYTWAVSMVREYEARHGSVTEVCPASKQQQVKIFSDLEISHIDHNRPLVMATYKLLKHGISISSNCDKILNRSQTDDNSDSDVSDKQEDSALKALYDVYLPRAAQANTSSGYDGNRQTLKKSPDLNRDRLIVDTPVCSHTVTPRSKQDSSKLAKSAEIVSLSSSSTSSIGAKKRKQVKRTKLPQITTSVLVQQ